MRYPLVAASYILIHPKTRKKRSKYDRLRSAFGLESGSTPQIDTHWRHYLKSRSDKRLFSNRYPFQILRSMADLLVRVRAYVSDVIGHRFEKVRNDHFEKWTPIWEFVKRASIWALDVERWLENLKKNGHRSEVQISVT
jgi:hypothetical protein